MTAAQAADLPAKARPVQYVKICSLYGAGFFYIPGTDTCIKIGGYLRAEWKANAAGSFLPAVSGANAQYFRGGDQLQSRARGTVSFDVREQTGYGMLRSYLQGGWQYTSNDAPTLSLPGSSVAAGGGAAGLGGNNNVVVVRAFVQFAGFTVGKVQSSFDFFDSGRYSHQTNFLYQDDGRIGINQIAYAHAFGSGVTATIALEDGTFFSKPIKDLNQAAPAGTVAGFGSAFPILSSGGPTNSPWNNAGNLAPDIVGNLRIDQAWGAAQVMAGVHDNRARYYQATANGLTAGVDHPSDKWGWALGAGLRLNLPTAKGDSLDIQTQYCRGWSGRCIDNATSGRADQTFGLVNSGTLGLAWTDDAYLANSAATGASGLELPDAWNVYAGVQHYWIPAVRSSLYGGYVHYNARSKAVDTLVCAPNGFAAGCANWSAWQVGSRTVWNPVKTLDLGVDVLYTDLSQSAFSGGTVTFTPAGAAANTFTIGSTHLVSAIFRVQRNFWP